MTVSVDIEVARRAKTLVLAVDAIHDSTGAEPWVIKITQGKAKRQSVKIGLRGGDQVEILDGLQAGDQVIPVVVKSVADGTHARPARKADQKK